MEAPSCTLNSFEEEDLVGHSINSNDLYAFLAAERARYWYAFIPYCFGTTWEGALVAPDRSLLIPCLHDEPFAHLKWTSRVLRAVRAVCFHVPAERALAESLVGPDSERFQLVGEGVDLPPAADGARFRRKYRMHDPFLLYAGRKAAEKNPQDGAVWKTIAELELSRGNLDAGREALSKVPADQITDTSYLNLGILLYNKKQNEAAEEAFGKAIQLSPDNPDAYYYRGLARMGLKHNADAKADFQKYLELVPDGSEAETVKELLKSLS